jgi:hypothetical protein
VETSRFSDATSRRSSSVTRFRTVESWVGQQANQLEERSFQEYLEREIQDKILESPPPPPKVPRKGGGGPPPSKGMMGAGGGRLITQNSDSPFFRAHPGTEVRLPRSSLIPSEILDGKLGPRDTRELIRGSFERRGSEL